jgi:hypothetical protein
VTLIFRIRLDDPNLPPVSYVLGEAHRRARLTLTHTKSRSEKPPSSPKNNNDTLIRAYQRGVSIGQLSLDTGPSRAYIRRHLQLAKLAIRSQKRFPSDPAWWRAQIDKGLSPEDLALKLGCSTITVYRYLRRTRPPEPSFQQWLLTHSSPDGQCRRWMGAPGRGGYVSMTIKADIVVCLAMSTGPLWACGC